MKVLVICGDRWHPAEVVRKGLEPLKAQGFEFDFLENAAEWSEGKMEEYPVILFAKSNNVSETDQSPWMTEATGEAFNGYVERGGTFVAVHSGTAGYQKTPWFGKLLGGVFTHHPEQCQVSVEGVGNNEITTDFKGFRALDEHYFIEMNDPKADIFIKTVSQHGEQPGGWTRSQGKGKVYAFTPGHNLEVWLQPEFQNIMDKLLSSWEK